MPRWVVFKNLECWFLLSESLDDQFGYFCAETSSKIWEILYKSKRSSAGTCLTCLTYSIKVAGRHRGTGVESTRVGSRSWTRRHRHRGWGEMPTWDFDKIMLLNCKIWHLTILYLLAFVTVMFFNVFQILVKCCSHLLIFVNSSRDSGLPPIDRYVT